MRHDDECMRARWTGEVGEREREGETDAGEDDVTRVERSVSFFLVRAREEGSEGRRTHSHGLGHFCEGARAGAGAEKGRERRVLCEADEEVGAGGWARGRVADGSRR